MKCNWPLLYQMLTLSCTWKDLPHSPFLVPDTLANCSLSCLAAWLRPATQHSYSGFALWQYLFPLTIHFSTLIPKFYKHFKEGNWKSLRALIFRSKGRWKTTKCTKFCSYSSETLIAVIDHLLPPKAFQITLPWENETFWDWCESLCLLSLFFLVSDCHSFSHSGESHP